MKIAIFNHPDEVLVGLLDAFRFSGHHVAVVDRTKMAILDVFDDFSPDIILCYSEDDCFELRHGLEEYPQTKVILFGITPPEGLKVDVLVLPSDFDSQQLQLFLCPTANATIQLPVAANTVRFQGGRPNPMYSSELFFYSDLMGDSITKQISKLGPPNTEYLLKVAGPNFPSVSYVGNVTDVELNNLMASTLVAVDFNHKHWYDYAANKVFCYELPLKGEIDWDELGKYIHEERLRNKIIKERHRNVTENHTYIHRANELLGVLSA